MLIPRRKKKPIAITPQAKYKGKNLDSGLIRVTVWVPHDKRETLLKFAKKCRDTEINE